MAKNLAADDHSDADGPKKSSAGLFVLLGGGCAGLLLLLVCGGGLSVGVWYWKKPTPNKEIAKVDGDKNKKPVDKGGDPDKGKGLIEKIIDIKPNNPLVATRPIGKTPEAQLAPPVDVWNFTLRLPKEMVWSVKDRLDGGPEEPTVNSWHVDGIPQKGSISLSRFKMLPPGPAMPAIRWLIPNNGKFKSEPGDAQDFDTISMPEVIEMNGLPGARKWLLLRHAPNSFQVLISYRYHLDGHMFVFTGNPMAPTEEQARQKADVIDVALCTFRKKGG